jgi:hypothetical protein
MKSIAFRAIKNSNGYVRSAIVGNAEAEPKSPGKWALVIAGGIVLVCVLVVCFSFLTK